MLTPPTTTFNNDAGHATNDGLRGASVAAVVASVQGWLSAAREAAGPTTAIFLCVPFGGFGSANAPKGALKTAFDAYQASLSKQDARTFYIDLGREAAIGLECGAWERGCIGAYGSRAGASVQGCDGKQCRCTQSCVVLNKTLY